MKEKFIYTSDSETYLKLKQAGFQEIKNEHGDYIFLNSGKFDAEKIIDMSKIRYSSILNIWKEAWNG